MPRIVAAAPSRRLDLRSAQIKPARTSRVMRLSGLLGRRTVIFLPSAWRTGCPSRPSPPVTWGHRGSSPRAPIKIFRGPVLGRGDDGASVVVRGACQMVIGGVHRFGDEPPHMSPPRLVHPTPAVAAY